MEEKYGLDFADMITEPGPDKVVSERGETAHLIYKKVLISVNNYHSNIIVIAGHHDCAANPVSREKHLRQIQESMKVILGWQLPVTVAGLY